MVRQQSTGSTEQCCTYASVNPTYNSVEFTDRSDAFGTNMLTEWTQYQHNGSRLLSAMLDIRGMSLQMQPLTLFIHLVHLELKAALQAMC